MDLTSLLNNDSVKGILSNLGIEESKQSGVINQLTEVIHSKASNNPKELSSLASSKPNTSNDNAFQSAMQNDFVKNLVSKVGLSDTQAKSVAGALPDLMKNIDFNSITSIISMLSNSSSKKGGLSGMLGGILGGFLKK
ncbi:MAG: hypothetical protein M9916_10530 [Crocinitomicaceae bacterium]|nr:hypothetical protein [Crocinitomicaceae bacterium]